MDDRLIWASGHGFVLLVGLAVFAFVSGYWGILIALAPAAYLLVFCPNDPDNAPKVVAVSHLVALIAGWVAYTVLAQGISPTSVEPMSEPGLRIVGSALLAFVGCTAIFYALHVEHLMAYVTAFTAAIGSFPTIHALAVVVLAILFVASLQVLRRKWGPETDTVSDELLGNLSEASNRR